MMKYKFTVQVSEVNGHQWHVAFSVEKHNGVKYEHLYTRETVRNSDGAAERWVGSQMREVWGL